MRSLIERNYALYGIQIEFDTQHTDVITDEELTGWNDATFGCTFAQCYHSRPPWGTDEITNISSSERFHQSEHPYMIIGPRAGEDLSYTQSGRRQWRDNREETLWIAIFTDSPEHDPSDVPSRFGLTEAERTRAATAKTAVHELGHHLRVGEAEPYDAAHLYEIYSGAQNDSTPEEIENRLGIFVDDWCVMSSGVRSSNFVPPTGEKYTAFSIEELLTIRDPR